MFGQVAAQQFSARGVPGAEEIIAGLLSGDRFPRGAELKAFDFAGSGIFIREGQSK